MIPAIFTSVTTPPPGLIARPLSVVNSNTTYGIDTSAANNYGLGPAYMSTQTMQQSQQAAAAMPSWWWLVAFLILVEVVL